MNCYAEGQEVGIMSKMSVQHFVAIKHPHSLIPLNLILRMIGKGIEDKTEKSLSCHYINHGCADRFTTVCSSAPL